jgi:hypothetical protein
MIEVVGAVFTGLTGVLLAVGGLLQQRSNRKIAHAEETEKALERQNTRMRVALAHVAKLEEELAAKGVNAPERPKELSTSWQPGDEGKKPQAVTQ